MRPKLATSTLFYMNDVIKACSVEPSVIKSVQSLIRPTGKRGRPQTRIDGRKVISVLKRNHANNALKSFKEFAATV